MDDQEKLLKAMKKAKFVTLEELGLEEGEYIERIKVK